MQLSHKTVLPTAAVQALALTPDASVIDATLGSGGHTRLIAEQLGEGGHLLSLDADPSAVAAAQQSIDVHCAYEFKVANFRHLDELVKLASIDAVLADLGWRTEQFTGSGRGFSFQVDEPLLMTFGDPQTYAFTASDIVNDWETESLLNILRGYGEERFAARIVQAIDKRRQARPIATSVELADIVSQAVPGRFRHGRIHPATKTFQALRITVNDELGALDEFISAAWNVLRPGGRLVIITFHSLEDRVVKHRFRALSDADAGLLPHKKPVVADDEERTTNPRARSAKLRTIIKKPM